MSYEPLRWECVETCDADQRFEEIDEMIVSLSPDGNHRFYWMSECKVHWVGTMTRMGDVENCWSMQLLAGSVVDGHACFNGYVVEGQVSWLDTVGNRRATASFYGDTLSMGDVWRSGAQKLTQDKPEILAHASVDIDIGGKLIGTGSNIGTLDLQPTRLRISYENPYSVPVVISATPHVYETPAPLGTATTVSVERFGNVNALELRWQELGNGSQVDLEAARVGADVIVFVAPITQHFPE